MAVPHRHEVAGAGRARRQLIGLRRQSCHQGLVEPLVRHLSGIQFSVVSVGHHGMLLSAAHHAPPCEISSGAGAKLSALAGSRPSTRGLDIRNQQGACEAPHQVPHVEDALHGVRLAGAGRPLDQHERHRRHALRRGRAQVRRRKLQGATPKQASTHQSEQCSRSPARHTNRFCAAIPGGRGERTIPVALAPHGSREIPLCCPPVCQQGWCKCAHAHVHACAG